MYLYLTLSNRNTEYTGVIPIVHCYTYGQDRRWKYVLYQLASNIKGPFFMSVDHFHFL